MDKLKNIAQRAFYMLIGGTVIVVKNTSKFIEELPEQIQNITEKAIAKGEATYQTWKFESDSLDDWNWNIPNSDDSEVSPELKRKLLAMVNADKALAERLLAQLKQKYPNCATSCYYEKVISDLKRDRASYESDSLDDWNWNIPNSDDSEVSPELKRKLLAMVNADKALAERLLAQLKQKYPNCATSCYYEKVISDLKRDRAS